MSERERESSSLDDTLYTERIVKKFLFTLCTDSITLLCLKSAELKCSIFYI